ncbi:MAG: glycosyltransferase family 2 protein [Bacteroides sp.]|nr:glycosyltransferase family 2 protein [Bacteroides sp.]
MKRLAVIILNWNGLKLLEEFIPIASRFTTGPEVDLIVADNGSTDASVEWLKEHHPEVKVIKFKKNYGFAEGYNRAIEQTKYPFTLLLNSDVEVTEGWWQPLLKFMERNPDVGAAQPKIKSYHNREMFEYAGAAGGYLDKFGYPYCRGRLFDSIEKDEGQYDDIHAEVAWASGAALIVRTGLYLRLGGLDPKFFAHMEEIDLCLRIHISGYRVCALSCSEVYHVGGASLNQGNPRKTYLNFRNNLLLLHKNLPAKIGKRRLFVRRLVDTLAFLMFCAKFDFPNAKAVLKAHSDFKKMRKEYTEHPSRELISTLPGAERNIIIDRFLLRKKK